MSQSALLIDLLRRVLIGDPWHADSVLALLAEVSALDATRRLATETHSIWELVLHMTAWADEVRARLDGRVAGKPAAGDWPAEGPPSEEAWATAKRALFATHAALAVRLEDLDDVQLSEPVVDHRDRAAGTGLSKLLTLHGLVHHSVYHAGQIAILRRAIEGA